MNISDITDQDLNSYLLGTMSPADVERFDELSITSDEFAEALAAAEMDLVDAYVNGDLSAADRVLFEQRYKSTNSGRSKIIFADSLQEYGYQNGFGKAAADLGRETRSEKLTAFQAIIRNLRWGFAAVAAAVVVVAIGGLFFLQSSRPSDEVVDGVAGPPAVLNTNRVPSTQTDPVGKYTNSLSPDVASSGSAKPAIPQIDENRKDIASNIRKPAAGLPSSGRVFAFSLMPPTRSVSRAPEVFFPNGTERVSVRLELETHDFSSYQIILLDGTNREIWRGRNVRPSRTGAQQALSIAIPARILAKGTYRFSVAGLRSTDPPDNVGDYPFSVVR
jgi:hypothetical protein